MSEVDPKVLEESKKTQATLIEVAPGVWKGPWLETLYDNRSECWRANIRESELRKKRAAGLNEQGQTPEEAAKFKEDLKQAEEMKKRAKLAEQMVLNTK